MRLSARITEIHVPKSAPKTSERENTWEMRISGTWVPSTETVPAPALRCDTRSLIDGLLNWIEACGSQIHYGASLLSFLPALQHSG